jgi:hypothetical protein
MFAEAPAQIVELLAETVGLETTATVRVLMAEAEHPVKFPVTVYTVVPVGETETEDVFAPVFQVYVVTPLAVNVTLLPAQTEVELAAIDGALPTETDAVVVFTQPAADVPVTV